MKILIDTNILIDFICAREPYHDSAKEIFSLCANGVIKGYIASLSIMNAIYITRKIYDTYQQKELLLNICDIVETVGIEHEQMISILENDSFSDIEDCYQMHCAQKAGCDYIITRNVRDYKNSSVQAILPDDLLSMNYPG